MFANSDKKFTFHLKKYNAVLLHPLPIYKLITHNYKTLFLCKNNCISHFPCIRHVQHLNCDWLVNFCSISWPTEKIYMKMWKWCEFVYNIFEIQLTPKQMVEECRPRSFTNEQGKSSFEYMFKGMSLSDESFLPQYWLVKYFFLLEGRSLAVCHWKVDHKLLQVGHAFPLSLSWPYNPASLLQHFNTIKDLIRNNNYDVQITCITTTTSKKHLDSKCVPIFIKQAV